MGLIIIYFDNDCKKITNYVIILLVKKYFNYYND